MAEAEGADQLANLHLDEVTGEKVRFVGLQPDKPASRLIPTAARAN